MSFKRAFERNVNKELQEPGQGRAPAEEDSDIKKHHDAWTPTHEEEEDCELSAKKDRPPRFSTLFAGGAPPPVIVERDSPREKRSGVFIPLPLFILLAMLLFLMSTFVFAYTIIGLYNNRPAGMLPGGFSSTPINGCDCADKQAGINIAPNFVMPGVHSTATVTVTASNAVLLPNAQTSAASSTSSSTLLNPQSEANAVASQVKSMLSTLLTSKASTTSSPKPRKTIVATVTPPPTIVATSTAVVNVNSDGSTVKSSTTTKSPKLNRAAGSASKSVISSAQSAVHLSGVDNSGMTADPSSKGKSSPTEKDDASKPTTTDADSSEPTPCDPLSLTNNCQH